MRWTSLFVEEPVQQVLPEVPAERPPQAPPMSQLDEVRLLENEILERGVSREGLDVIENERGTCKAQLRVRSEHMHEWLASHP